jgi:hypothetical protein
MQQKGAAIKSTLLAIVHLYGESGLASVKGLLPQGVISQIEPHVLPVAWYPIEVSAAIHVAVRDALGGGDWTLSHAIGIEAARIDFNGIYRVFLRSMQYDTMWDRAERAWANYNSQGHARWEERTAGQAKGLITDVSGFNWGVWNAVAGRLEALLQLSGARSASVQAHDATPTSCHMDAMWLE